MTKTELETVVYILAKKVITGKPFDAAEIIHINKYIKDFEDSQK